MKAPLGLLATLLLSAIGAVSPGAARGANSHAAMSIRLATSPVSALALGEFWVPLQYLDETPAVSLNHLGRSVRMAGDLLVVGAPYAADGPSATTASGRAYIYRLLGGRWQFEKLLTAPAPQTDAHFGLAIGVSNSTVDFVVIGEPDRNDANGADVGYVYVYEYINGAWVTADVKKESAAGNRLGAALDAAGDYYAVGIPGWDASAQPEDQNIGQVQTLHRCASAPPNNWCIANVFSESALHANARLGSAIAIAGERVIAGAPLDSPNGIGGAGSAWIDNLVANGPVVTPVVLTDPTPNINEFFGVGVGAAGNAYAAAAPKDDEPQGAAMSGAVYVFKLSGDSASLEATLRSPGPQTGAAFGGAIEMTYTPDETCLVIGEPGRDVFLFSQTSPDAGAVHVFRRFFVPNYFDWENVTSIYNYLGDDEAFGFAVASADGTQFAAGAPNRSVDNHAQAGEVTVYRRDLLFADGFEVLIP